jgi:hypothetical protein
MPRERRCYPRFPFHSSAILTLFPAYHDATLIDLSMRGALVELDNAAAIAEGVPCTLRVLGNEGRQVLEFDAVTAFCNADGRVGLEIVQLAPGVEHALRRLIEMNLGTQKLLERDLCALLRPRVHAGVPA